MKPGKKSIWLIKLVLHLCSLIPLAWLIIATVNGHLGADPVEQITHFTGKGILHTLFASLLITPLARWFKLGFLYHFRRLLGLYSFFWATLHMMAYFWFDLAWEFNLIIGEITSRNYLVLGMFCWILLLFLSLTSTKAIRSRLGTAWQKLHNWVYVAAIIGPIHYYWSVKSAVLEPSVYILLALMLLIARKDKIRRWLVS